MVVMKFGGTSVQDSHWIDQALSLAAGELSRAPVVVVSAMGKTTDHLESIADYAVSGDTKRTKEHIDALRNFHESTVNGVLTGQLLTEALKQLASLFDEIESLVKGLTLLRECTLRSRDALLSFGERLAAVILYYHARERGIPSELLDSRDFIKTDARFTSAIPIFHRTNRLVRENVVAEAGKLIITQGFIGSTEKGVTTTIGRGGSDYTATIIASALHAEEVQIWTDIDGIMTSDPAIVPEARTIRQISYEEAAELAYFGAKVVHPSTIQPAVELGIPVRVKNTRNPTDEGTVILPETDGSGIRAIAGKKQIILITVTSSRMINAYGFMSRIFSIFEKHRTPVDLVATSEVSVSTTIETETDIEPILKDLSEIGTVSVFRNKSIICLVGKQLWKDPSFIARVFGVLTSTPIRMISLGSSDINLSIVVPEDVLEDSIRKLHREFFPPSETGKKSSGTNR